MFDVLLESSMREGGWVLQVFAEEATTFSSQDEIVVRGRRIYTSTGEIPPDMIGPGNFPGGYPDGSSPYYQAIIDPVTGVYDNQTTRIDTEQGVDLTAKQEQAAELLKQTMEMFRSLLKTNDINNPRAVDKDGNTVFSGQEFASLIKNVDFLITNRTFERDGATAAAPTVNRIGQADVYVVINADKLVDWMGSVDKGGNISFYEANAFNFIAHEIGHSIAAGRALAESVYKDGLTDAEHFLNEGFAFSAGRAALEMFGKDYPNWNPWPAYGEEYIIM